MLTDLHRSESFFVCNNTYTVQLEDRLPTFPLLLISIYLFEFFYELMQGDIMC